MVGDLKLAGTIRLILETHPFGAVHKAHIRQIHEILGHNSLSSTRIYTKVSNSDFMGDHNYWFRCVSLHFLEPGPQSDIRQF